jgi:hypothetical protein
MTEWSKIERRLEELKQKYLKRKAHIADAAIHYTKEMVREIKGHAEEPSMKEAVDYFWDSIGEMEMEE